jgi:hypothetical protein
MNQEINTTDDRVVQRRESWPLKSLAIGTAFSIFMQQALFGQMILAASPEISDGQSGTQDNNAALIAEAQPSVDRRLLLSGAVATEDESVERLTKQVMAKIFELERLNTYFRIESTRQSKWRKWRQFVADEQAAFGVGAGVLVIIIYALRGVHRGYTETSIKHDGFVIHGKFFQLPRNTALEDGIITTIPFIWVSVLQEIFEIGQNYFYDWKAKQRGFDYKTTRAKATALQNEIDSMLAQRASLLASASATSDERAVQAAEGKVLKDMRDLSLLEYKNYYSGGKKLRAYQNTFYMTDIAERVTGFTSLLMGLVSLKQNKRNELAALGILQIVSAILAPAAPIFAKMHADAVEKHAKRSIDKDITGIEATKPEVFDADRKHLEDLVLNSSGGGSSVISTIYSRDALYRLEGENLQALDALSKREHHQAKSAYEQSVLHRFVAFGNKTAFGSVAIAGGFTHLNNPRHYDQLLLGATTPYEVTLDIAFVDTFRRQMQGMAQTKKERAKGELVDQVYEARLDRLEKMESIVKTPSAPRIGLR